MKKMFIEWTGGLWVAYSQDERGLRFSGNLDCVCRMAYANGYVPHILK